MFNLSHYDGKTNSLFICAQLNLAYRLLHTKLFNTRKNPNKQTKTYKLNNRKRTHTKNLGSHYTSNQHKAITTKDWKTWREKKNFILDLNNFVWISVGCTICLFWAMPYSTSTQHNTKQTTRYMVHVRKFHYLTYSCIIHHILMYDFQRHLRVQIAKSSKFHVMHYYLFN